MRDQPTYVAGALVSGLPAEVISAVLRAGLEAELRRRTHLTDEQRDRVRDVQAAIRHAAQQWLPGPRGEIVSHAQHACERNQKLPAGGVPPSRVELLSTGEAAKEAHMTPTRMAQLAREGAIGRKVGRDYVITRDELNLFLADRHDAP